MGTSALDTASGAVDTGDSAVDGCPATVADDRVVEVTALVDPTDVVEVAAAARATGRVPTRPVSALAPRPDDGVIDAVVVVHVRPLPSTTPP